MRCGITPMEIMTTKEACEFLKCSRSTLNRLREAGLPYHQIGQGKVTFRKRSLERWWLRNEKGEDNVRMQNMSKNFQGVSR